MITYLLVLMLISSGAIVFFLTMLQSLLQSQRVNVYDARGFYLVAVILLTFTIASLAYFWGELRFYPVSEVVSESLVGVLIALSSSLIGLAFGLVNLSGEE